MFDIPLPYSDMPFEERYENLLDIILPDHQYIISLIIN